MISWTGVHKLADLIFGRNPNTTSYYIFNEYALVQLIK